MKKSTNIDELLWFCSLHRITPIDGPSHSFSFMRFTPSSKFFWAFVGDSTEFVLSLSGTRYQNAHMCFFSVFFNKNGCNLSFVSTSQYLTGTKDMKLMMCSTVTHKLRLLSIDTKYGIYFNSSDAGDGIFRLWVSLPCLLMPWLLKSPGHQQKWYLHYGTGNI